MLMINQLSYYPTELLTAKAEELHDLFPNPTLFHLKGRINNPLFISVLLHGNETTGFLALQKLLKKYHEKTLPRSLSFFLGNTEAASQCLRVLDHQPDYNRIWPGTELNISLQNLMTQEIINLMREKKVFASIDIHNNTGINPHYACINNLNNSSLYLASLFSRLVVFFTHPKGVQSAAFAKICPAVTLECGKPGQQNGVDHAFEYLNSCLHLPQFSDKTLPSQDIDIYHTVAQIKINPNIDFSFHSTSADLLLDKDIERMNFTEIPAGTQFGQIFNHNKVPVTATDDSGKIVTDKFFSVIDNSLQINRAIMPSMLTLDKRVIRQDCLCYLMERIKP
jgi:succinylglutamate desuccinylase